MIEGFEGNRAETKTMIPLVQRFVAAHGIAGVTVIADACMMSEAKLAEVEDADWSFVIGGLTSTNIPTTLEPLTSLTPVPRTVTLLTPVPLYKSAASCTSATPP